MNIEQIRKAMLGECVSIAPEIRLLPVATNSTDEKLPPFVLCHMAGVHSFTSLIILLTISHFPLSL